jgi:hypothetical protein
MTYQDIFEQKTKFKIINNYIDEIYQFQPNETNGEFINQDGNVIAQLVEANPNNDWFAVAGIFMGEITLKAIQYKNITSENQLPINLNFEA